MIQYLASFGVYLYPIVLVTLIILVLTVLNGLRLLRWRQRPDERLAISINAILFWGVVCAVLGFLGQWAGIYRSMTILSQAEVVNPAAIAKGFAQSLQTSILGLRVLLLASLVWLGLRSALGHLETRQSTPEPRAMAEER